MARAVEGRAVMPLVQPARLELASARLAVTFATPAGSARPR